MTIREFMKEHYRGMVVWYIIFLILGLFVYMHFNPGSTKATYVCTDTRTNLTVPCETIPGAPGYVPAFNQTFNIARTNQSDTDG